MDAYSQIVEKIIERQTTIIGPIAVEQANSVSGLHVEWGKDKHHINISGDGTTVIDKLVEQYKNLFGQISVEVCKEAARPLINKLPAGKHPKALE